MTRSVLSLALAAAAALCASPAFALESYLIPANAKTCSISLAKASEPCKALIYAHFKNGRTTFTLALAPGGDIMYTFSGGEDSQPTLSHYHLVVDHVLRTAGATPVQHDLHGACDLTLSVDGHVLQHLTCDAGPLHAEFEGDGAPADVVDLQGQ